MPVDYAPYRAGMPVEARVNKSFTWPQEHLVSFAADQPVAQHGGSAGLELQIARETRPDPGRLDSPARRRVKPAVRAFAAGSSHAPVRALPAAISIAAGHPTHLPIPLHSRGGDGITRPVNREPQLLLPSA
jgi:hypothetical protein